MVEGEPLSLKVNQTNALRLIAANGTSAAANPGNLSSLFKNYLSLTLTVDVEKRSTASELLQVRTTCHPSGHPRYS